uniref:Hematopoietic cell signal transducer n=1 Tax=Gopherus agassizii TaxID=38772 RepID=A0A452HYJ0_9SAUR
MAGCDPRAVCVCGGTEDGPWQGGRQGGGWAELPREEGSVELLLLPHPLVQTPGWDHGQGSTPVIVGLVIGDLVFTLVLILVVYHCTKRCGKPTDNKDQKVYMNMPGRVN